MQNRFLQGTFDDATVERRSGGDGPSLRDPQG
jgi:hypothetical protein